MGGVPRPQDRRRRILLDVAQWPQASARVCGVASPPRAPEPSAARAGLQGQSPWFAPDAESNGIVAVKNKDRTCV